MPERRIATKQMIEQVFDDAATSYDRHGPPIFAQMGSRLVNLMHLAPSTHVLDIATGTGAVLLPAAKQVGLGGHVTGIDLSGVMLQETERAVSANGLTNIELHKMDAEHLEFPDQSFDVVTCAFAIFFFPNIEATLSEIYRVCKPGGRIAMINFNKTPIPFDPGWSIMIKQCMDYRIRIQTPQQFAYTPSEMKALLNRFGFHSVESFIETDDFVYSSLEEWWAFILSLFARASIMGMDEKLRERFKDEYFAKLRPMIRNDGLHISLGAIYSLAKR